ARAGRGKLLAAEFEVGDRELVVRARPVDAAGRVEDHLRPRVAERGAQPGGVPAGERRRAPALRVTEEELDDLGIGGPCHRQRVTFTLVGTKGNHAIETRRPDPSPRPTQIPLPALSSETAGSASGLSWFGEPFRMIRRI